MVRGDDNRSLKWHSGDFYEGDLDSSGRMHGQGKLTYAATGDCYVGSFESGLRHGVGAYHYGASGVVTVSQFSRDRLVGVGLRWSGDRRKAWALFEGKIEPQNYRVAPHDPNEQMWLGQWQDLTFHPIEHGQVTLGYAWQLAVAFGLAGAAQSGRAQAHPRIDVETRRYRGGSPRLCASPRASTARRSEPTPAMRQAAYMTNFCRPTVDLLDRSAPPDEWPWPLANVVAGTSTSSAKVVDRSIFTSIDAAARASAKAVAAARQPEPSRANISSLYESIRSDMRRLELSEGGTAQPVGGVVNGVWVTPGAGPMEPSPTA